MIRQTYSISIRFYSSWWIKKKVIKTGESHVMSLGIALFVYQRALCDFTVGNITNIREICLCTYFVSIGWYIGISLNICVVSAEGLHWVKSNLKDIWQFKFLVCLKQNISHVAPPHSPSHFTGYCNVWNGLPWYKLTGPLVECPKNGRHLQTVIGEWNRKS